MDAVERFYGEYYFRPRVAWRVIRKAIFNSVDRRTGEGRREYRHCVQAQQFVREATPVAQQSGLELDLLDRQSENERLQLPSNHKGNRHESASALVLLGRLSEHRVLGGSLGGYQRLAQDLIPIRAEGHAARFKRLAFSGSNEEYLDPARYQYREFFILLDALFEGRPVSYCPYIFVDNDAALARGWTQGYPKRLGSVFQTRYYAATGKAGPALAAGSKFAGSLSVTGGRLAEGIVTLREPVKDLSALQQRPVVNLLHCPAPGGGEAR